VVLEQVALDKKFQCMSPTRFDYIKLGLELVSLEGKSLSHTQETLHGERKEK
jgi:hypothetical protein